MMQDIVSRHQDIDVIGWMARIACMTGSSNTNVRWCKTFARHM